MKIVPVPKIERKTMTVVGVEARKIEVFKKWCDDTGTPQGNAMDQMLADFERSIGPATEAPKAAAPVKRGRKADAAAV